MGRVEVYIEEELRKFRHSRLKKKKEEEGEEENE